MQLTNIIITKLDIHYICLLLLAIIVINPIQMGALSASILLQYQIQQMPTSNLKYIRVVLTFSLLLTMISMTNTQNRYTKYIDINNPELYTKVAYSLDKAKLIFYSEVNNKIDIYRAYDYSLIRAADTTSLMSPPTALQYFQNKLGQNTIIYGTSNNQIVIYSQTQNASYTHFELPSKIIKIEVSSDNLNFVVICQGDTNIYSGSTQVGAQQVKKILFDFGTSVSSIRWRPTANQIAVVGGNNAQNKNKVVIYNIDTQLLTNLTDDIKSACQDIQFSEDGLKIAYIQKKQDNFQEQLITIMDLVTKQQTILVATGANKIYQLKRYGNFLSAYDSSQSYVWKFDSIYLGKISSTLKSSGISPDGQDIIGLSLDGKSFQIYKLCPNASTFYSQPASACVLCSAPCKSCIFYQTRCTSCISQFYVDLELLKCAACLNFCETCEDNKTCEKCLDKYYNQKNSCKLCESSIQGCIRCSDGKICQLCDTSNNWIINKDNRCQCNNKFVNISGKCEQCPSHCWECSSVYSCQTCDRTENRKVTPVQGQCLCQDRYFEDKQQICQLCMTGCSFCNQKDVCLQCDSSQNRILKDQICVCSQTFIEKEYSCVACSTLIEGCSNCDTQKTCVECSQGYTLNTSNKICDKSITENNILVVVLVGVAILIGTALGTYFLVKTIKKRRQSKKVQTLIQSTQEDPQTKQTQVQ